MAISTHSSSSEEITTEGDEPPSGDNLPSQSLRTRCTRKIHCGQVSLRNTNSCKKLKHYLLGEQIGEGSYGVVKEVLDTKTGKRHVVKIITDRKLRNIPGGVEGIQSEMEIMRHIDYRHCIKCVEFWRDEESEKAYFVMEYVGGGSLRELMERAGGKIPIKQARRIFRQLLKALQYLHSKGLVHRDVKPENIMLTTEGSVKLSDFGVTCSVDDGFQENDERDARRNGSDSLYRSGGSSSSDGSLCSRIHRHGSPAYQPPEVASGKCVFSGVNMDIWAAGVVLYEMVVGKYPFHIAGGGMKKLMENISKAECQFPEHLDTSLASLLHGVMEPEPNKRMSIFQIQTHPWMLKRISQDETFAPLAVPNTAFPKEKGSSCVIC